MTNVNLSAHRKSVVLNVDPEDHIGKVIWKSGKFYEQALLEDAYQKLLYSGRPGLVIDVGAHVGNHSMWFAKVCGRGVIAVEPNRQAAVQIESHARLNRVWDSVRIFGVALGAEETTGRYEPGPDFNTGMGKVVPDPEGEVPYVRLDDLMEALNDGLRPGVRAEPAIALIKIDVEGSAVDVLRGAKRTLEVSKPLLYIEGDLDELQAELGPAWRSFGKFAKTPTWGFRHADS